MKLLYLLVDIFTIAVPLLFSIHPKLDFYKTWKALSTEIPKSRISRFRFELTFAAIEYQYPKLNVLSGIYRSYGPEYPIKAGPPRPDHPALRRYLYVR